MNLRWYQVESVRSCWDFLCKSHGNPVIMLPTGAGKSLVIAELCREAVEKFGGRVLCLAHRKELLQQNAAKIRAACPGLDVGMYSAGLDRRDTEHAVVVAGIQSVFRRAEEFGQRHLVLIDEVHLVPHDGEGMYRTFLDSLRSINPHLRMAGLTATPYRLDAGPICRPDGLFQKVCYSAPVRQLIEEGFLCKLTTRPSTTLVDTSGLKLRGGEFVPSEAERLFSGVVDEACRELVAKAAGRRSVLVFASGVAHADQVAMALEKLTGERVGVVTGDTWPMLREQTLADFRAQRLRWCVNVDVLTTGFDAPNIDAIAVLRATMSPGLFAQIVGRGFRMSPGKADCIAEGQRVLTDQGLVPIEKITRDMKVWDGVDFVSHCGIILRGEQPVISYAGLTATEDHNVWTKEGWKTLGECSRKQIPICVTGDGRNQVRVADGYFRGSDSSWCEKSPVSDDAMHRMRETGKEEPGHAKEADCWMPEMREKATQDNAVSRCPQVAIGKMHFSQRTMLKSEVEFLEELRRAWHNVSLCKSEFNGCLGDGKSRRKSRHGNRSNQQRWSLRAWESAACIPEGKLQQPEGQRRGSTNAQVSYASSGSEVRGLNSIPSSRRHGTNICGSSCEVFQEVKQAKRRVWDILNAGPNHRFTCEGLLVSNCLVLDFGGNIKRHGPIDSPEYGVADKRQRTAGEAPVKTCPNCGTECLIAATECRECGWQFPRERDASHDAKADDSQILSEPEVWLVERVSYAVHHKRKDPYAPPTLRVDYECRKDGREGNLSYETISEWICLQHEGFALKKARRWWLARSVLEPPDTIQDAVDLCRRGAVAAPRSLVAVKHGRWWRVLSSELEDRPEEWADEWTGEDPFAVEEMEVAF